MSAQDFYSIFSWENKKKIAKPLHGQVVPLLPKASAFLLFRVWLQTFLLASSKSNNRPLVPWEHRGGRAQWERGIRHTARTRGQRWEKKTHREKTERRRERGRGVCIWKVLSASRQGPLLCENDKERKSTTAEAKNEKWRGRKTCHVFYQTWRLRECV